jgi:AcrR family transcriptional regulator
MQTIRERIIEHAAHLFVVKGCKSLTMDDIANSMGISKRTIYENFQDKEELLQHCLCHFLDKSRKKVIEVLNSDSNIIDAMFKQTYHHSQMLSKMKYDFFNELRKYFPSVYKKVVQTFKDEHLCDMEKMLHKGQKDGVFRDDLDIPVCAGIIQGFVRQTLSDNILDEELSRGMQVMHVFMENFTRGMATKTGLHLMDEYKTKVFDNKTLKSGLSAIGIHGHDEMNYPQGNADDRI